MIARVLKRFLGDRSGATAIEYGALAALIVVVGAFGLRLAGTSLDAAITTVAGSLASALDSGSAGGEDGSTGEGGKGSSNGAAQH